MVEIRIGICPEPVEVEKVVELEVVVVEILIGMNPLAPVLPAAVVVSSDSL